MKRSQHRILDGWFSPFICCEFISNKKDISYNKIYTYKFYSENFPGLENSKLILDKFSENLIVHNKSSKNNSNLSAQYVDKSNNSEELFEKEILKT